MVQAQAVMAGNMAGCAAAVKGVRGGRSRHLAASYFGQIRLVLL
jgi:hypothetical protein